MMFRAIFQFHDPSVFTPRSSAWNIMNCCNLRPSLGTARILPNATQHGPQYCMGHAGDVCPLPPPTRVMTPHNQQLSKRLATILGIACQTAHSWCGFSTVPDPLPVKIRDIRNYTPYLWKTQLKRRPK